MSFCSVLSFPASKHQEKVFKNIFNGVFGHQDAGCITGGPNSLHERGRDSCLRAVLCYKRLFTKACMGSIGFS